MLFVRLRARSRARLEPSKNETEVEQPVTAKEVDDYLAQLDEPRRATLERLRQVILTVVPEAEQGLSYGSPVFRVSGRPVAGFSAATRHLSYLPHSGDVLASIDREELGAFTASKGAVKMPVDTELPVDLVRKLIDARRAEAGV